MTSEPVGNGPRIPAIQGNSHKAREAESKTEPIEEKEPVQKVIEGKVVRKKAPWYKRATNSMIAEDAGSVREYVLEDIILPNIKRMILESVTGTLERSLFGSSRIATRRTGPVSGIRNKYHDVPSERPRALSHSARSRFDFDEITLDTREEAVMIIEFLDDRIQRYRSVTVNDLYTALGVTGDPAALRWGWTDLRDADVRTTSRGFLLDLPKPEPLR